MQPTLCPSPNVALHPFTTRQREIGVAKTFDRGTSDPAVLLLSVFSCSSEFQSELIADSRWGARINATSKVGIGSAANYCTLRIARVRPAPPLVAVDYADPAARESGSGSPTVTRGPTMRPACPLDIQLFNSKLIGQWLS